MAMNWQEKREEYGLSYYDPWRPELKLYQELMLDVESKSAEFYLDNNKWKDDMAEEADQVRIYFRKKSYMDSLFEKYTYDLLDTESRMTENLDKIKKINGDVSKILESHSNFELKAIRDKKIKSMEKSFAKQIRESNDLHKLYLNTMVRQHRDQMKTEKRNQKDRITQFKETHKQRLNEFKSEWDKKYT